MADTPGGWVPSFDELGLGPAPESPPQPVPGPAGPAPSGADTAHRPGHATRLEDLPDVTCPRCGADVRPWQMRTADGAGMCLLCAESVASTKRNRLLLTAIGAGVLAVVVAVTLGLLGVSRRAYATGPKQSIDRFNEAMAARDSTTARRYVDSAAIKKDLAAAVHVSGDTRSVEMILVEPSLQNLRLLETHETTALAAGAAVVPIAPRKLLQFEVHYLMRRQSSDASGTLWVICGMPNVQTVLAQLYAVAPDFASAMIPPADNGGSLMKAPPTTVKPPSAYLPTDKSSPYYSPKKDPTSPYYDPAYGKPKPKAAAPAPSGTW